MMLLLRKKKMCGFTLLEMVIVLIIITIIYTFAAPSLSRYNMRKKLLYEADKMSDVIELVKSHSVTQRQSYKLVIDASNKEYYYMLSTETGKQYHRDKVYHCDPSIAIQGAPAEIGFGVTGSVTLPTGTTDPTITLRGSQSHVKTIVVNRRTGKVSIT
ncbi:MAG: prepilin-type N-terminal cleavage/methylation domain-containing protein [Candidatus Omnitrophica bacterium]|nr:prepilin-type N-terminal cleavage/methylation domain-containing protein [Candidatus Omnitrophota bacterium]